MKDQPRQSFRTAAHTAGVASVKPRDYELSGEVEAPSPYSAWSRLRQSDQPLDVGDILEDSSGALRMFKYVGWEEARWQLPEVSSGVDALPVAVGMPPAAGQPV
jgi:hypothetical protein